jgi:predicted nuclease with TOPRIM domain
MFNGKLKQKISELEKQVSELKKENSELKTKYSEIIFLKENPNKYDVSDKTNEGIILEKRIKDNTYPKCFLNPLFNYIMCYEITKAVILRKPHDENNLKMLTNS